VHSSWLNWAFTKESYAVARFLFRERYSPVEVRPGQTPAHSRPLIPYTTTRDTIPVPAPAVRPADATHGRRQPTRSETPCSAQQTRQTSEQPNKNLTDHPRVYGKLRALWPIGLRSSGGRDGSDARAVQVAGMKERAPR